MDDDTLALIDRALAEDVGDGDATAEATVDPGARARATITQKAPGVISGLEVAEAVFRRLDPHLASRRLGPEGEWREGGPVLEVEGAARALLTAERTALNFLGRLSGVATASARMVRAVEAAGGTAKILDTRKTTPGMRRLEKRAVADGGAVNHRAGLFDFVLIKENHAALAAGAPRLLLDNMTPDQVRAAVTHVNGRAVLEASGGVDAQTVLVYATIAGLDYVSMGAITHSAPSLDLSLLLEPLPS
jgi:nicotinate-nucleotide pyrophosphorylase (carboxylating)